MFTSRIAEQSDGQYLFSVPEEALNSIDLEVTELWEITVEDNCIKLTPVEQTPEQRARQLRFTNEKLLKTHASTLRKLAL